MTEAALEAAAEDLQALREEVREDLAEDLGGDPEDYSAERYFEEQADRHSDEVAPDGGDA